MNLTRRNLHDGLRADGVDVFSEADVSFTLKNIKDVMVRVMMKGKFTARLDPCHSDIHVFCPLGQQSLSHNSFGYSWADWLPVRFFQAIDLFRDGNPLLHRISRDHSVSR